MCTRGVPCECMALTTAQVYFARSLHSFGCFKTETLEFKGLSGTLSFLTCATAVPKARRRAQTRDLQCTGEWPQPQIYQSAAFADKIYFLKETGDTLNKEN